MTEMSELYEEVSEYVAEQVTQLREKFPDLEPYDVGHALLATGLDEIAAGAQTTEEIIYHYRIVIEMVQQRIAEISHPPSDMAH